MNNGTNPLKLAHQKHLEGNLLAAKAEYEEILLKEPNNAKVLNFLGVLNAQLGNIKKSIEYLHLSVMVNPADIYAINNLGSSLRSANRLQEAISCYEISIALDKNYDGAHFNLGVCFQLLGQYERAIQVFEEAIAINPEYGAAYFHNGICLLELKKNKQAISYFEKTLSINKNMPYLLGAILHAKMQICDWESYDHLLHMLLKSISANKPTIEPFQLLSIVDDPEIQLLTSKIWAESNFKPYTNIKAHEAHKKNSASKIRLGYFSSDFCHHAVMDLVAGIFENHDRNSFDLIGFSLGDPNKNDAVTSRVRKAFDHYFEVGALGDFEIIEFANSQKIDIAIDLNGYTKNCRPKIFSSRIAPIQINFLGYPGTMGISEYDYIIADEVIIPTLYSDSYSEKVIYMPDSYQANDSKRHQPQAPITRADIGLDENAIVFCCFNNAQKITPEIYSTWMDLLAQVDNSQLWLIEDNLDAAHNLRNYAKDRHLSEDRIIFAEKISHDLHLNRIGLADIFLDTTPYNGHTTASDALWAGVPVVTIRGRSFASRVAASLLNALDLNELVTENVSDYKKLCLDLAQNQSLLKRIKKKLGESLRSKPLFNTVLYTSYLEKGFKEAYLNNIASALKKNIYIKNL